jgi:Uma2 family endonuclease
MNARARVLMTFEDYLDWESRQEEKYEYVDGEPVLRRALRGMAGGTRGHAMVASDLLTALSTRLWGAGPCVAHASSFKVRSPTGNARYPEVTIDCSRGGAKDLYTSEPTLVAEVLSPSNRDKDADQRLADYKAIPSLEHIIVLSQDGPSIELWTRRKAAWSSKTIEGRDGALELPALGLSIPLEELYRDAR